MFIYFKKNSAYNRLSLEVLHNIITLFREYFKNQIECIYFCTKLFVIL